MLDKNKHEIKNDFFALFLTMLKIGAFTFGGGYAMIPLLEDEFVHRKNWLDRDTFIDIMALSQSIPGPIAVNASIIIGYRRKGIAGSLAAIFGLALPSLITITLITYLYTSFQDNIYIAAALRGIRACVVGLIFSAFVRLFIPLEKTVFTMILLMLSFFASLVLGINSIYIILSGILIGLIASFILRRKAG